MRLEGGVSQQQIVFNWVKSRNVVRTVNKGQTQADRVIKNVSKNMN